MQKKVLNKKINNLKTIKHTNIMSISDNRLVCFLESLQKRLTKFDFLLEIFYN